MERFPEMGIRALTPGLEAPVVSSLAKGGKRLKRMGLTHNFICDVEVTAQNPKKRAAALWFLNRHRAGEFELVVPFESFANGPAPSGVQLAADAGKGASQLLLSGFANDLAEAVCANDPLRLGNHTKVYRMGAASSNAQGQVTVEIDPPLRVAVSAGELVTLDAVPFTVMLDGLPEGDITKPYNPISFAVVEVV
ncbi:hypothetical protein [Ferrimonas sp.]|uniref:hypothetical protein n=1 Tax=Ferrimonas sp. TaxID=2080861 RepID=UPI003A929E61